MRYSHGGLSLVEGLLIVAVLLGIGLVSWRFYGSSYSVKPVGINSPHQPNRIIAVGDIACDPASSHFSGSEPAYCQAAKTYQTAKTIKAQSVLALGDLQYENGSLDKFENSYAKTWGILKSITYPAPGNHEYSTPKASGYYSYFGASSAAGVDISRGYYSFNLGTWHLISLNSNCSEIGGCGADSAQMQWLDKDLQASSARCTLAFWHHPRFTSGSYATSQATSNLSATLWASLYAHKADVILNGHDHIYERFALQTPDGKSSQAGIRQFTVGTGGKEHYKKQTTTANSEKIIDDEYGVLAMDLDEGAYKWRFVTTDGKVKDSGYQQCSR